MSTWHEVKKDDLTLDGEDINIYLNNDDLGANYAIVKIADIKALLEDNQ